MPDIASPLDSLVRDVELLCLDAGNTMVFLDHARLAQGCGRAGFLTTGEALRVAEGEAKLALDRGALETFDWSESGLASARSWGNFVGTALRRAGLPAKAIPTLLGSLWYEHRARNLWYLVPEGMRAALLALRATGARIAVVSNSEGKLEALLEEVGLRDAVDLVLDSALVGVEKPDPRIFRIALEHFGVAASRALHLGDTYGTDVVGARSAAVRVALVDPYGHLDGHHADVPRVPGAVAVARALAASRSSR